MFLNFVRRRAHFSFEMKEGCKLLCVRIIARSIVDAEYRAKCSAESDAK